MAEAATLPTEKLGLGMGAIPSLPQQFAEAKTENTNAMKELETAKAESSKARLAGAEKIGTIQDMAPKQPELAPLPADFKHQGMSDKDMTDSMQTMFFFAALGGAMTRTPMTAALNAFGGALKGMVQGDQEVFKRETATFDRHLKTAMTKNNEAMVKYKQAFEKHKGDLGAAMQEIQLEAAAHNDTVTGALARANNAKAVMGQIQAMAKADSQMQQTQQRFDQMVHRQDQQHAERMKAMELNERRFEETIRQHQVQNKLAEEKQKMKDSSVANMGKPSATERQHYVDSNQLLKSVDRVEQMLANPATRAKIDESRVANFLSDGIESKAIQQFLVRPNLDPDVKKYLTEVANLRNQYYLDMSGKAVTGGEALRNYGAVVQPGDTADDVLNKMQIAKTRTAEKMRDMETYFPGLSAIKGGDRRADPPAAAKAAPTDADRQWAKEHPEDAAKFEAHFGVKP